MFDTNSRPSGRLFRLWTANVPESHSGSGNGSGSSVELPSANDESRRGKPWRLLLFDFTIAGVSSAVMPGLDPGIHLFRLMDCRVKPGNDRHQLRLACRPREGGDPVNAGAGE